MFCNNGLVSVVCCFALLPVIWLRHGGSAACEDPAVPHFGSINTNITLQCTVCSPRDGATWYLEGGDDPVDTGTGTLMVPVTESSGGSIYRCECGSNVQCHIILVNPYFTTTFGPRGSPFIRSGDTFTLVCEADGFPRPEQENFSLAKISPPPVIHFQQRELVPTDSGVDLSIANASKERHSGQYRCIVNTEWSRGPMPLSGHNSTSTTMTVYDPPFVRSTTNFTLGVTLDSSTQPAATLECSVQSRDGEVTVQWERDGQVLQNSAKHVIADEPIREADGVLVYLLTVRKLTEDDLGAYECQLFSNFSGSNPEAVRRIWINSRSESKSCSTGSCDVKYIIIIVILVVIIFLLVIATVYVARQYKKTGRYDRARQVELAMNDVSSNGHTGNGDTTVLTNITEQEQQEAASRYHSLPGPRTPPADQTASRYHSLPGPRTPPADQTASRYHPLPGPHTPPADQTASRYHSLPGPRTPPADQTASRYHPLPGPRTPPADQTELAEDQEERSIPNTDRSEQRPATEMDSPPMVSRSEDIQNDVGQRYTMPATAQLENTASGHGSRGEETPVVQSEIPQTLERPSQSSAPTAQDPSPQSPRRASPRKPRRGSGQSSHAEASLSPRSSIPRVSALQHRRRSSSSLKDLVLSKRRGDDSQRPLAPHNADSRTPSDSD